MARTLQFFVEGEPVPQGSVENWRGRIVGVKAPLKAWRNKIRAAALQAAGPDWELLDGPIAVDAKFQVLRPKTVKRPLPSVTPDLDKMFRAAGDALTETKELKGIFTNDSRITDISTSKRYAGVQGVLITVTAIESGA